MVLQSVPHPQARNLVFIFDVHLTFSDQISSLARASTTFGTSDAFALSLTSVQPTSLAHHSIVHSKPDYCNSLYWSSKNPVLQHIHNSLARAVVAAPRSSDPDQILKSLHWLKVQERIEYKIIYTKNIRCYTYVSTLPSRYHYHPAAFTIHSVVVTGHSPSPTSSVESQNH